MTITQTVEIPASRRLTIDIPPEIPAGMARVIIFPVREDAQPLAAGQSGTAASGSLQEQKKFPVFGCLKGQIQMSDDFDEPLEDFKDYM